MLPVSALHGTHFLFVTPNPKYRIIQALQESCSNRSSPTSPFSPSSCISSFVQTMQKKGDDGFQRLGICHRLFNFIMSSLIGRVLKRVTLGYPMPQDSTNQGAVDESAMNEVQEPLTSRAEPTGEEWVDSKLKDDSDSIVKIRFRQTEELDHLTPVDKVGSSVQPAEKDEKAMEKRNEFNDITKAQVQGKTEVRIHGEGSTGPPKIIIPTAPTQPDVSSPMLTGLGLNINEISETFIQNTKERMIRNISLTEPE